MIGIFLQKLNISTFEHVETSSLVFLRKRLRKYLNPKHLLRLLEKGFLSHLTRYLDDFERHRSWKTSQKTQMFNPEIPGFYRILEDQGLFERSLPAFSGDPAVQLRIKTHDFRNLGT